MTFEFLVRCFPDNTYLMRSLNERESHNRILKRNSSPIRDADFQMQNSEPYGDTFIKSMIINEQQSVNSNNNSLKTIQIDRKCVQKMQQVNHPDQGADNTLSLQDQFEGYMLQTDPITKRNRMSRLYPQNDSFLTGQTSN